MQHPVQAGVSLTVQAEEEKPAKTGSYIGSRAAGVGPNEAGDSLTAQAKDGEPVEQGRYIRSLAQVQRAVESGDTSTASVEDAVAEGHRELRRRHHWSTKSLD